MKITSFISDRVRLIQGDCLETLSQLPENSLDAACIDPPYHLTTTNKRLAKSNPEDVEHNFTRWRGKMGETTNPFQSAAKGFMGKVWDGGDIAFKPEVWAAVYRVLKPGAHMVVFGGSRTFHRVVVAIEDAGFEVREMLVWVTGQNFPKSVNISRVIDERKGLEGEVVQSRKTSLRDVGPVGFNRDAETYEKRAAVSEDAIKWEGWGTALKNSIEPICLARKPLGENTIVDNVLKWDTGALNVDGCRVETDDSLGGGNEKAETAGHHHLGWHRPWNDDPEALERRAARGRAEVEKAEELGRWPPNVLLDTSEEVESLFPETTSGKIAEGTVRNFGNKVYGKNLSKVGEVLGAIGFGDTGSASRFYPHFDRTVFYHPKASRKDRIGTQHPTVKPVGLLRWLVRLITPPGGMVLDCFAGTGTTGEAAVEEGMSAVLIERETEYCEDIKRRMRILARQESPPDNRPVLRRNKDDSTLEGLF